MPLTRPPARPLSSPPARGLGQLPAVAGGGAAPAPEGPDYLFVNSAQGLWFQYTPLSKLKQDSAGTTAVASNGDVVGYLDGWNASSQQMIQTTTGSKPTYNGSSIFFDAPDIANTKGLSKTQSIPDDASAFFVFAARVTPKSAGELRIGCFVGNNDHYHAGFGVTPQYGVILNASNRVVGYSQQNARTHGTAWALDTPISVAFVGNGVFGDTSVYVNGSELGLYTASYKTISRYGIGAFSGQWEVTKGVMMYGRSDKPEAQEITDLFAWLETAP